MFYRYLFALAAVLCAAAAYAVEPPVIRETVEPPSIKAECECSTGAPCICGESCSCTVPVIAPLIREDSHNCPKCGTFQNVVEREFGGSHSHLCKSCGTEWVHADPGVSLPSVQYAVAPPRNPFATENCPDGNCARGAAPRIVGSTAGVVRSVYGLSDRPRLFSGDGWRPGKLLGKVFGRLRGVRGGCCN